MTADYIIPENEVTLERIKDIFAPYYPARIIDRDEVVVVNLGDGLVVSIEINKEYGYIQYNNVLGKVNLRYTVKSEDVDVANLPHTTATLANLLNDRPTYPLIVSMPDDTLVARCRLLIKTGVLERHITLQFQQFVGHTIALSEYLEELADSLSRR